MHRERSPPGPLADASSVRVASHSLTATSGPEKALPWDSWAARGAGDAVMSSPTVITTDDDRRQLKLNDLQARDEEAFLEGRNG